MQKCFLQPADKQSADSMGLQKIREEHMDHIKPVEDKLNLN